MIELTALTRPAGDLLSRVVRVTIGGQEYVLPVRSIRANQQWKERLDANTSGLLNALQVSEDDLGAIYGALAGQLDEMIDLLTSYDTGSLLPSKEEILDIEPDASMDVLNAVLEVWRAANPLVAHALDAMSSAMALTTPEAPSSPPSSSPPPSTAGSPARSSTTSATSSSSRTSTRQANGKHGTLTRPSSRASRPSGSAPSSPTT